jgi:UDP-N-acetyl-2-amino-2-deoxyglucuronate dehydrogenase
MIIMTEKIGVGVVGLGAISEAHFKAIHSIEELRLVGVASSNPQKGQDTAERNGCKAYSNYLELIEDSEVQMVVLLTPPGMHTELIQHAIKNKKHLFVEKPVGTNLTIIDDCIRSANEAGVLLSVVSQHRFDPASLFARDIINKNMLGDIAGANCLVNWYRDDNYYTPWRTKKETSGGGVLAIQAIHTIDLMLWLLGDVKSVKGYTKTFGHKNIEVEDLAMACIQFNSGALCMISATTCAYPGYPTKLDIFGMDGSLTIEGDELAFYHSRKDTQTGKVETKKGIAIDAPGNVSHEPIASQYRDIIVALKTNKKSSVSGEEARKTFALIDAIYESAKTGREIVL